MLVPVHVLGSASAQQLDRLLSRAVAAAPTYPELGAADAAVMPAGYRALDQSVEVAGGVLADALLSWGLHRAAGMCVAASGPVALGTSVVVAAPFGVCWVAVPCRVVAVIDEPDRRGFLYGSLPGHPLRGEERFTVERGPDGRERLRIRSFSVPAGLSALAPPVAWAAQATVNRRYLAAARSMAA